MKTYEQLYDENGNYRLDESYTEILKLHKLLIDANIPHTLDRFLDGWQIVYPNTKSRVADAIQHYGSYGNEKNLLEIMGLLTPIEAESDSVLGCLTAEDVFNRMREHYTAHNHVRKTNYDRIKNMSVEELAEFIKLNSVDDAVWVDNYEWIASDEIKKWLESEVTEE